MKSTSLMIIACAWLLAGCQTHAEFSCAGWSQPPKPNNAREMVEKEKQLTQWIVATDHFGQKQGCWK